MDPSANAPADAPTAAKGRSSKREALAGRVERTRERALAAREKHTTVDLAFSISEHDRVSAGGLLAAAVAFRLFLWVLPAALVVVGGLGFARPKSAGEEAKAVGIGQYTASQIEQATAQAHRARWVALVFGIALLYLASVALAKALNLATHLAWRQPPQKLRHPLRAAVALNVVILLTVAIDFAMTWLRKRTPGIGLSVLLLSLVLWVLLWWVVSKRLLPHPPEVGWMSLLPGALVFGFGLYLLHLLTILYLGHKFATASKLYGALGVAATMLLWAFFLCRLVVASAAVDATWNARKRRDTVSESPSEPAAAALSER